MKTPHLNSLLLAAGLVFCATDSWADNILANGKFTDGKAHWKGDGQDAGGTEIDNISASMANQGLSFGMKVDLKPDAWTMVSQIFNTRETELVFSMGYRTSSDFAWNSSATADSLITTLEHIVNFPLQDGTGNSQNPQPQRSLVPHAALVVVADPSQNLVIYTFAHMGQSTTPATTGAKLTGLMAHEEKTLYVAFPPGQGTITFSSISLDKPGTTASSDNPFQQ